VGPLTVTHWKRMLIMGYAGGLWKFYVPSAQCFYEPKTVLKIVYFLKNYKTPRTYWVEFEEDRDK
jgi:hypothetical protein